MINRSTRLFAFLIVGAACFFNLFFSVQSANAECGCLCFITKNSVEKQIDLGKVSGTIKSDDLECLNQCDNYLQKSEGLNSDRDNFPYRVRCTPANTACWCNGPDGAYKKTETIDAASCQTACKSVGTAGQEMAGFGNTPPTPPGAKGGAISCPPGGDWTSTTCKNAKNSEGVPIGRWNSPGPEKGPYCFYNDAPIKLGVGLGSLTQANLAQYLAAAYNLSLGFAAVLAVIFIMIGGFRYLSAAGGAGVEEGKGMIKNAVIGLVLAALSYTLLLTINPDILSLRLPTIQLIKACDIAPADCGSLTKQADCNNNSDSSKKCSWNDKQSVCIDLATTQSGSPGKLGGECKPTYTCANGKTCIVGTDSNTGTNLCPNNDGTPGTTPCTQSDAYSCSSGSCVKIDSNTMKCSAGGPCEACTNDSDIDPATGKPRIDSEKQGQCRPDPSGLPIMCISNKCATINPNNPPKISSYSKDNYTVCTNAACTSDSQCPANQKCNDNHVCIVANQGTTGCSKDSDCRTQDGQKCVSFTQSGGVVSDKNSAWKTACCANGDGIGCLGCNPSDTYQGTDDNSACPKLMKCDPGTSKCIAR